MNVKREEATVRFSPRERALTVATIALFVACVVTVAPDPDTAEAALRGAAGGGGGRGGFARLSSYMDHLASYLIALAVPLAVLGLIYGGALFISGSPKAGQVLGYVAVGFILVVASKGLAA
jgi:hypothetical protein